MVNDLFGGSIERQPEMEVAIRLVARVQGLAFGDTCSSKMVAANAVKVTC
jgi:hypothetical protein